MRKNLVVVRGGGDIASGTIHKLASCGFGVIVLEIPNPTVIRRTVSYAQAVFAGEMVLEGIRAIRIDSVEQALSEVRNGTIPVLIDPLGNAINSLKPGAVVDAIIAKRNIGTHKDMAPVVVGLGPGFTAPEDVHAVIETNRGHNLGRVIYQGRAEPDTGHPGMIGGYGEERIIRSPAAGIVRTIAEIGDSVKKDSVIAYVGDAPVFSPLDGVLRGLIHTGTRVGNRLKIGDVDPRNKTEYCTTISDKARAIAGGVLEAILRLGNFKLL